MTWKINQGRKKKVCTRIKEIRIKRFGEGRGAQKEMARALGIPYTTYRGYEENRVNDDFLRMFAKKFGVPLLWLMAADDYGGEVKTVPSAVLIDPGKGVLNSGQYIILQMPDDGMEPTIPRGATVGVLPIKFGEPVPEKLVAVKIEGDKGPVTVRRLLVHGNSFMVIPDNPHLSHDHIDIKRKDILGQVVWQFSVI